MTCFNSGTRSTMSSPFGSSASRSASRHLRKSSSFLLRSGRMRLWNAWASVAYGMSRLYWSNLPDANRPRGGTSGLWSSFTTADLPMPEYPETSTSSGRPPRNDAVEGGEQGVHLTVPPVQLLGDHEAIRSVMSAESEIVDASLGTPIATGSAEDRSQLPPPSDTAPRPSWRAASS